MFDYLYMQERKRKFRQAAVFTFTAAMVILVLFIVTFSWYGSSDEGSGSLVIADLSLEVESNLNNISGVPLEPNRTYTNTSTYIKGKTDSVESFIRVRFECEVTEADGVTVKPINFAVAVPVLETPEDWVYDNANNWYYYIGICSESTVILFNSGIQVSNELTNELMNLPVKITLTVQALQKEYQNFDESTGWNTAPEGWRTAVSAL